MKLLKDTKVVVGLSGGVDSSVVALLLKQAGFDVAGVYLKCYWTYEGCQSDQDRNSAARVASVLDIPFEVWDFEKEYRKTVVDYFFEEYKKGRTPNPDVVCNREIKFGLFLEKALGDLGGLGGLGSAKTGDLKYIATGHYARIGIQARNPNIEIRNGDREIIFPRFSQYDEVRDSEGVKYVGIREYLDMVEEIKKLSNKDRGVCRELRLYGGVDGKKDQSYFLYDIPTSAYEHILYPLGNLTKKQVREIAKKENLPTAGRPDSSGICFIGEVNIEKFLKERISEHEGNVVNKSGGIIGKHKGVEFYTIGQRHGFQIENSLVYHAFSESVADPKTSPRSGAETVAHGASVTTQRFAQGVPPCLPDKGSSSTLAFEHNLGTEKKVTSPPPYEGPWYVISKNVEKNELVVGMGEECKTDQFSVKIDRNLKFEILNLKLFVRIRNLGEMIPCELTTEVNSRYGIQNGRYLSEVRDSDSAKPRLRTADYRFDASTANSPLFVNLAYPVFGIAPGQSAVFYRRWVEEKILRPPAEPDQDDGRREDLRMTGDKVLEVVGGGIIQ